MPSFYDPDELAHQKQIRRDRDVADVASGRKSLADLAVVNGVFHGQGDKMRVRWDLAKPLK